MRKQTVVAHRDGYSRRNVKNKEQAHQEPVETEMPDIPWHHRQAHADSHHQEDAGDPNHSVEGNTLEHKMNYRQPTASANAEKGMLGAIVPERCPCTP